MQAFAYRDKALLCHIPRRLSTLQTIQGVQEIALLPVSKQVLNASTFPRWLSITSHSLKLRSFMSRIEFTQRYRSAIPSIRFRRRADFGV